jgi:hypothetical protein
MRRGEKSLAKELQLASAPGARASLIRGKVLLAGTVFVRGTVFAGTVLSA